MFRHLFLLVFSIRGLGMTSNIFSNFSTQASSVPAMKASVVTENKEKKKVCAAEVAKVVVPIATTAIAIPVTAAITYKMCNKNTEALKKQLASLGDDVQKLKDLAPNAEQIGNAVKKDILKNTKKENAKIWSALLAVAGLTGSYSAGKMTQADKDNVTTQIGNRVNGIDNRSNQAISTANYASNAANAAISKTNSALSTKYTTDYNGISLLTNNDAGNRNSKKYETAIKTIQNAAPKYLQTLQEPKLIRSEKPTLWSVSSEFQPIKEGGLGSVPVEIQNNVSKLGIEMPTFIPMYQREGTASFKQENGKYTYTYKDKSFELEKVATMKVDSYQGGNQKAQDVEFYVTDLGGKQLVFVKNDTYFDGTIYQTTNKSEEPEKFAFFSKAVYEFAKAKMDERSVKGLSIENRDAYDSISAPDAFVLNDWQASPIAALARYKAPMENAYGQLSDDAANKLSDINIITIGHNAMYQGSTGTSGDVHQKHEASSNILNTLFDKYALEIVQNAKSGASETNPSDKGLENLDNTLIFNANNPYENHTNLLNMGISLSNYFHPVSQNYANELISPKHSDLSGELQWALVQKANAGSLIGIINGNDFNNISLEAKKDTILKQTGLDYKVYNKSSDIDEIMTARTENKKKFYNEYMIPFTTNNDRKGLVSEGITNLPKISDEELKNTPIIASVGRLVDQKGSMNMSQAIEMLMNNWEKDFPGKNKPIFYIAGADGEGGKYIDDLKSLKSSRLSKEDSNRVVVANGFAPMQAITAASDFFLLPSKFEPCGLTQGESFALATPVVASAVGGIVDTVNRNGKTNGILASMDADDKGKVENLYNAMKEALEVYFDNPEQYKKMVSDSLAEDFSWIQAEKQGPVFEYLSKIGINTEILPDIRK